jgi:hypothetical protein
MTRIGYEAPSAPTSGVLLPPLPRQNGRFGIWGIFIT